jgi:type II secretory pathway component PulJ
MPTNMKLKFYNKGFSLVEMLVYISVLTIIFVVIVETLLSFTSSYHRLAALRSLDHTATDSLERVTRDIRNATSIDAVNSVFGGTAGALSVVATQNSISTTTKFYLASQALDVNVNGTLVGPLTNTNVAVTALTFTSLTSTNSTAVKVDMTLAATDGPLTVSKIYHSTIILKGS